MKAVEAHLLPFLRGTQQLRIPIYQRTYSWTRSQVDQLWRDILRVAQDPAPSHFIGSIVYIQDKMAPMSAIPELLVIDGQQRLTTLTLLIIALRRAIKASPADYDVTAEELDDYYLRNPHGKDQLRYKLLLTQRDHDTLRALLNDLEPPTHGSSRIVENYRFLEEQFNRPGVDLNAVYHGLAKLTIVDIRLERGTDNPQLIFESLNSTGLDLSQADLIRNFVLMDLQPAQQEHLFTSYWQPMEHRLAQTDGGSLFDRFMRDYLTIQTDKIPNIALVYDVFKAYVRAQGGTPTSAILADVERHSRHFHALASATSSDDQIRRSLQAINQLEVNVAYPFLMRVYDDYSRDVLANPDLATILRLVESYVFRRAVCAIPTNTLNRTFAALYSAIDPTDYVGSLRRAFARMTSYRRFPTDEEFRTMLQVRDVYNFRSRSYLLRKLETGDHVEPLTAPKITIEHIMPQRVDQSPEWQAMLGPNWQEVHAKYLHTLGNLTLTGYNPELSNKPFLAKRDYKPGGFADSHFHRLNRSLAHLDHWNAATIEARAAELADLAVKVWGGVDDLRAPHTTAPPHPRPTTRRT